MQSQGPYHNIQQLSDAIMRLESAGDKESTDFTQFLVSQVQPLVTRITSLESSVAALQAAIADLKGTPKA